MTPLSKNEPRYPFEPVLRDRLEATERHIANLEEALRIMVNVVHRAAVADWISVGGVIIKSSDLLNESQGVQEACNSMLKGGILLYVMAKIRRLTDLIEADGIYVRGKPLADLITAMDGGTLTNEIVDAAYTSGTRGLFTDTRR